MTTPANASEQYKDQISAIAGGWRVVQREDITVNTAEIVFTIPAGSKMARIEGLIVSSALVISPALTFNGLTTAIYNQLKINTVNTGDATPEETLLGSSFQFTSSFGNNERSIIDIHVPIITNVSGRQLFKGIGFNDGGTSGDYHTSVGWADDTADIATIELKTVAPFANGIEAGSFFTLSVVK